MSTKNSSAYNTLFSKERIETLIGGVKQAKDATKPSGKERTLLKHTSQREILVFIGSRPIYYIRPLQKSNITLMYHIGLLRY
jgi:hypothetical protein